MQTVITINGRIPSKKNSKQIVCRGRFPMLLSSKAYQAWHETASWELKSQKPPQGIDLCEIHIKLYAPDMHKADLTNKAESIMDLLVDNGVIVDDNWWVVRKITLEFMLKDKNPRAEVFIHSLAIDKCN